MATSSFDKPASKAREFISPSDLTFSWDGCHRCLWLNYNHGVKAPLFMPLVGELSAMQEAHFDAVTSALVTPELPSGKVHSRGGWVKSTPIVVNGSASPYAVRGKYDLLMEFDDGTWGVIDCKFQGRDSDKSDFYSPQLEAYAYSLENPAAGRAQSVASMGLLVWKPTHAVGDSLENYGFGVFQKYLPVERDQANFLRVIGEFIDVLEGDLPDSGPTCTTCTYLNERSALDNA